MHILIWTSPWCGQGGDLFFGFNAFSKHLMLQAETLLKGGFDVSVAFPSAYSALLGDAGAGAKFIPLDSVEVAELLGRWTDPAPELYRLGTASPISAKIRDWLKPRLPAKVDAVLLWETPAPFLSELYPDATIIHQMPGAFSRPPYPQMTVFDPVGLYKESLLFKCASDIGGFAGKSGLTTAFVAKVKEIFLGLPYVAKDAVLARTKSDAISLLPLQISDHYAFKTDAQFTSQVDFCMKALSEIDRKNGVFITEYVSRLYRDEAMTPEFTAFLQNMRPNVYFDPSTKSIPSVSQHLLPIADEIVTATSGLGFQAMVWDVPIRIIGDTHLVPYDYRHIKTPEQRRNVLSYLMMHYQPLASAITSDSKFLCSLIEEIHGRRGRPPMERLPDLSSIDRSYSERVMKEFRQKTTERDFVKLGISPQPASKVKQFTELVATKRPKLISFDLFDTLAARGFEQPADLYRFLEYDLRARSIPAPFDFAQKRLTAELNARANATSEEISLDDIYRELALLEGVAFEELTALRDHEIRTEIEAARERPLGRELFDAACETKIPICITSDMYLPRMVLDEILARNGYHGFDRVFLSSEIGVTKKTGKLFAHIAAHYEIPCSAIIHVGDNIKTDVNAAKKQGVMPFHIPRAVIYLWESDYFGPIFPKRGPIASLGRSVTAAAIGKMLVDDPKTSKPDCIAEDNPWKFGYAAIGPLVMGFALWVRRQAIEHNIGTLHFLSREGKIIKDIFDRLEIEAPSGVRSNYLWGSRRAIRVAQMRSVSDIRELANQTIDRTATLGSLLKNRFGLDLDGIDRERLLAAGFKGFSDPVGVAAANRRQLVDFIISLKDEILANSARERETYEAYLRACGLYGDERYALVDVGWNANMQGSLGALLGRPLTGLYFATLEATTRWKLAGHVIRAYAAEGCIRTDDKPILANRLMLENLLCDTKPTIIGVARNKDGAFVPVHAGQSSPTRLGLVSAVQDGARSFCEDVCQTLGRVVVDIEFHPETATAVLDQFLANPTVRDARLFIGQEIDDPFSGAAKRYLLAPFNGKVATADSYWREGERVLSGETQAPSPQKSKAPAGKPKRPVWYHRPVMPFVRPFVRKLGHKSDVRLFNEDPASFFEGLSNPKYRRIGAILFPRIGKRRN